MQEQNSNITELHQFFIDVLFEQVMATPKPEPKPKPKTN